MRGNQRISLKLDEDQNNPDKTLIIRQRVLKPRENKGS
jgi:hypothetical protein